MKFRGRRSWVLSGAVLIFIACLCLGSRLRLEEKITALFPTDDPEVQDYCRVLDGFHIIDKLFIIVGSPTEQESFPEKVVRVADALYQALEDSEWFDVIHYRNTPGEIARLSEILARKKACLFTPVDVLELESQIDPEKIAEALATAKRKIIEPTGPFVKVQVQRDPMGFDRTVEEKLKYLATDETALQFEGGYIWSGDGKHLLMITAPNFPPADTRQGKEFVSFLRETREKILSTVEEDGVTIGLVGGHITHLENRDAIVGDMSRATLAISLGIILLGFLFYRRISSVGLTFLPAAFGLAIALGIFALLKPDISGITLGCAAVLISIAVDYGIHILYWVEESSGEKQCKKTTVKALNLPISMGAFTTVAALFALSFSALPGLRQLGLFAGTGVAIAAVFSLFLLPDFIPQMKGNVKRPILPLSEPLERLFTWQKGHKKAMFLSGLTLLGICAVGASRIRFEGDLDQLIYLSSESQRDQESFMDRFSSSSSTMAVVRGENLEEALKANDHLAEMLATLKKQGEIRSFSTISLVLPAQETQRNNREHWHSFWTAGRLEELRAHFGKEAEKEKFSVSAFEPFFRGLVAEPEPVRLEDFRESSLKDRIESSISRQGGGCQVMSTFILEDRARFGPVAERIRAAVPKAVVIDRRQFAEWSAGMVREEFKIIAILASIAVALSLYLFLGRIELVLAALAPVGASVILTLGLLGFLGIPLNMMSILFIAFVFGVGVDFSIFILCGPLSTFRDKVGAKDPGSVIICALTTIFGFATLAFASHPGLYSIGITGLVGIVASLLASLLLVPVAAGVLFPRGGRFGTPSAKTLFGALWALVYLGGSVFIYRCVLRFIVRVRYRGDGEARERFARRFMNRIAYGLQKLFPYAASRLIYLGARPEQISQPTILVSNHQSVVDVMTLLPLSTEMVFVIKEWVWNAPLLGKLIQDAGFILTGDDEASKVLDHCRQTLDRGVSVCIFPEGRRSPDGSMRRFHMGAFELALRTGRDMIPILISDSRACIPPRAFWVGDYQMVVRVLPQLTPGDLEGEVNARSVARNVKNRMLAHVEEDWRLAQSGRAFWKNIRSLYNYQGAYVERHVAWKLRIDPICKMIDRLVPDEGKVLDVGCGYGLLSNILARKSRQRRLEGLDMDRRKIAVARRTALTQPNVSFQSANVLEADQPPADGILLIDVLHHWSMENQEQIIARLSSSLTPGGTLVFRDALSSGKLKHHVTVLRDGLSKCIGVNRRDDTRHYGSLASYLSAFEKHGLKLVSKSLPGGWGSKTILTFIKDG